MPEASLQQELVSLHEATAVTFHLLFDAAPRARTSDDLEKTRAQVALALGAVASILAREEREIRRITLAELEERVLPTRYARPDLSALYIRRCDLVRAIEMLRGQGSSYAAQRPDSVTRGE